MKMIRSYLNIYQSHTYIYLNIMIHWLIKYGHLQGVEWFCEHYPGWPTELVSWPVVLLVVVVSYCDSFMRNTGQPRHCWFCHNIVIMDDNPVKWVLWPNWPVVSIRWSVVSGQWFGQWLVVYGQWSAVSIRWSVVSDQWSVVIRYAHFDVERH